MNLATFFAGITCATFFFSGVFFLKFWRASRDSFFLYFCAACWVLSFERIVAAQYDPNLRYPDAGSPGPAFYLIRMVAFIIITAAIIQKNKKTPTKSDPRA